MITRFKSALNQIKAEDTLLNKTEMYLTDTVTKNRSPKKIEFIKWRLFSMKSKLATAICLAILFIGVSGGTYALNQTPVSYLSLDINPSVELGVNTFGKVVKAEGYNDDGKRILSGINVKGSNVAEAVSTLISSASRNGFIAEDGSTVVSLTSETDNKNTSDKIETDAEAGVNEALKGNGLKVIINKDNVALARRDEARALGITPGKLNLIQKLQALDSTITVDEYKDAKVTDIQKKFVELKNNAKNKNKDNTTAGSKSQGIVNGKNENKGNSENKGSENSSAHSGNN